MDEWKKLSSHEIEVQRLLNQEKLLRDEASLVARAYEKSKYKTLTKNFKSLQLRGFEDVQIRGTLEINDSDYRRILDLLDNTE